jgi:hypothetical protein
MLYLLNITKVLERIKVMLDCERIFNIKNIIIKNIGDDMKIKDKLR